MNRSRNKKDKTPLFINGQWQARSQDLEKGGGGYLKSEKSANDLDPNFLAETDFSAKFGNPNVFSAHIQVISKKKKKKKGLHRFQDWFFGQNRISRRFFRPNSGDLQKKKKVFTDFETDFLAKVGNTRPTSKNRTFKGGLFSDGGLFSIFHHKLASKAPKTCDFAYFTSQW